MATVTVGGGNETVTVLGNGTVYAGSGNDSITIYGNGLMSVGGGHDTLSMYSGQIDQYGRGGNDTIHFGSGNDTLFEAGTATVYGAFGSGATISGGELKFLDVGSSLTESVVGTGAATLLGGSQPTNFVNAGIGPVSMHGGTANDTFTAGAASDTMTGGTHANVFEFLSGNGGHSHLITNFTSSDQLYLEGESFSYLQAHHDIVTSGHTTVITLGDGTKITVEGVSVNSSNIITKP